MGTTNVEAENFAVLGLLTILAVGVAVIVGVLSSETLRRDGIRALVKRWLAR